MFNILIVEDNLPISDLIKFNLDMVGYKSVQVFDGNKALQIINTEIFDLIILDIMLPGVDGYTIIEYIKSKSLPTIFLTAKDKVNDIVKGLKLGADDYMTKPFHTIELLARMEVILKRYNRYTNVLVVNDLEINQNERTVKKGTEIINLTLKEFELLVLLIKNKNIALSRERILELVWEYNYIGETRTVDVHIQRLRKKLSLQNIKPIPKIGYRLEIS